MSGLFTAPSGSDSWTGSYYELTNRGDWAEWQITLTQAQADILNNNATNIYGHSDIVGYVGNIDEEGPWWGMRKAWAAGLPTPPGASYGDYTMSINHVDTVTYDFIYQVFEGGYNTPSYDTSPGVFWGEGKFGGHIQTQRAISLIHVSGEFDGATVGPGAFVSGTNTIRITNTGIPSTTYNSTNQPIWIDFAWISLQQEMVAGNLIGPGQGCIDPTVTGQGFSATPAWFPGHVNGTPGPSTLTYPHGSPQGPCWVLRSDNVSASGHVDDGPLVKSWTFDVLDDKHVQYTVNLYSSWTGTVYWIERDDETFQTLPNGKYLRSVAVNGTSFTFTHSITDTTLSGIASNNFRGFPQLTIWFGDTSTTGLNSFRLIPIEWGFLVLDEDLTNPVYNRITDICGAASAASSSQGLPVGPQLWHDEDWVGFVADGEDLYVPRPRDNGQYSAVQVFKPNGNDSGITPNELSLYKYSMSGGTGTAEFDFPPKSSFSFPGEQQDYVFVFWFTPTGDGNAYVYEGYTHSGISYGPLDGPWFEVIPATSFPTGTTNFAIHYDQESGNLYQLAAKRNNANHTGWDTYLVRYRNNVKQAEYLLTVGASADLNSEFGTDPGVFTYEYGLTASRNKVSVGPSFVQNLSATRRQDLIWYIDGLTGDGADNPFHVGDLRPINSNDGIGDNSWEPELLYGIFGAPAGTAQAAGTPATPQLHAKKAPVGIKADNLSASSGS